MPVSESGSGLNSGLIRLGRARPHGTKPGRQAYGFVLNGRRRRSWVRPRKRVRVQTLRGLKGHGHRSDQRKRRPGPPVPGRRVSCEGRSQLVVHLLLVPCPWTSAVVRLSSAAPRDRQCRTPPKRVRLFDAFRRRPRGFGRPWGSSLSGSGHDAGAGFVERLRGNFRPPAVLLGRGRPGEGSPSKSTFEGRYM